MANDFIFETDANNISREMQNQIMRFPKLMNQILKTQAIYMVRETKKRFDDSMSPDGVPWKPLSGLTKSARRKGGSRAGKGHKPLLDTGMGKRSIVPEWYGTDEVKIGPTGRAMEYLSYHQTGAVWTRTKKQAWWMVFNLFKFDPKKPWEFTRTARRASEHKAKLTEDIKTGLAWEGWQRAGIIATGLMKPNAARIPARPFAGISIENIKVMEGITRRYVLNFFLPGRGGKTAIIGGPGGGLPG